MKNLFCVFFILVSSQHAVLAQYCMTAGPTSNIDSNVKTVLLTGTSGNINFTGCPGVLGVQDLTSSQVTTLNAGSSYSVTVEYGTCGGNFAGAGQVWIDFNGNQIFDGTESIGTWTGTPPAAPVTYNFTVPVNAQSGNTRMRVTQHEGTSILPLDPCEAFTWGSVMDFGIVITGGIDCSGYLGDVMGNAIVIPAIPYTTSVNTGYCYFNQNLVYASPDVYYKLITPAGNHFYHVSLCGSSFDTYLSVIKGNGNIIAYNDDGSCGSSSELNFTSAQADTFFIVVEGWGSESGTAQLQINQSSLGLETNLSSQLKAFPNPSHEFIQFTTKEPMDIAITDIQGKVIETFTIQENYTWNVSNIPTGIYFAKFSENGIQRTIKLQLL